MKKIICFLFGHKQIKGLFETTEVISNKGCGRCGSVLFTTGIHWKGVRSAVMPGATKEEWELYCDEKEASLRKEFSK